MTTLTAQNDPHTAKRIEYAVPAVDLHHDADGFTLEAEMPGVGKDGVEVTFDDGKLVLVGRRAPASAQAKVVYGESFGRDYRRVFDLDPTVDGERITASIDNGLLTVRLPKAEAAKPRRIEVR